MMLRQDRWTFGISVVVLTLACVCVAQAASAQTTGSIVQWGNVIYDLPTPNENFTAIAQGWFHGLGLSENSSIATWGRNTYGECDVPNPNRHFVAVAANYRHSLGLKNDGSIVAWGFNEYGQCDVPEPNGDFVAVDAGYYHSLGLKADGSVAVWGRNDSGQCDVPEPNGDFVAISGGAYHCLGLRADGSIQVWGSGVESYSVDPPPNTGFVAISAGCGFQLALKSDGSVVVWGGLVDAPAPNTGFVAIAAGYQHALGLKDNGSVVGWGANGWGQCDAPEPNTNFVAIAASGHQSLGLKADLVENQPPSAANDAYTAEEGVALSVAAPGVLGNDSDPDGDPIIAIWDSGPSHGTLGYLNADGSFEYTPATGFTGTDTFTYTAFDGEYDSNVATVTITVGGAVEPGGITGTVTDAGGPVKKATVTAYDALGQPAATGKTLPSGAYTLAGLAPGEYTVEAVLGELSGWAEGSVLVLSGQTTTGVDIFIE
jgi:hypothetical protein